jgi:hypothetical protein
MPKAPQGGAKDLRANWVTTQRRDGALPTQVPNAQQRATKALRPDCCAIPGREGALVQIQARSKANSKAQSAPKRGQRIKAKLQHPPKAWIQIHARSEADSKAQSTTEQPEDQDQTATLYQDVRKR